MTTMKTSHRTASTARLFAVGAALSGILLVSGQAKAQEQGRRAQRVEQDSGRGPARGPGRLGNPEQMVERRVARLTETLKLETAQAARITEILKNEQTRMLALRPQRPAAGTNAQRPARPDSATMAARRDSMKTLHEQTRQQIEQVLTAEQRVKFAESGAGRAFEGGGRRGGGPPGMGPRGGKPQRSAPPPAGR